MKQTPGAFITFPALFVTSQVSALFLCSVYLASRFMWHWGKKISVKTCYLPPPFESPRRCRSLIQSFLGQLPWGCSLPNSIPTIKDKGGILDNWQVLAFLSNSHGSCLGPWTEGRELIHLFAFCMLGLYKHVGSVFLCFFSAVSKLHPLISWFPLLALE